MKVNPWDYVEVLHVCGHTQRHRKFGRQTEREIIKAWSTTLCKECNGRKAGNTSPAPKPQASEVNPELDPPKW